MARPDVDLEQRLVEERLPPAGRRAWEETDERLARAMEHTGATLLRSALGIVFLWFGWLKVIGRSPVADMVADLLWFLPRAFVVRAIGVWEMVVGAGLLVPVALRATLFLFWLQMAGTMLVLVARPRRAYQRNNPLLLTTEGEFVVKNLVLIAAGIVVGGTVHRRRHARDAAR